MGCMLDRLTILTGTRKWEKGRKSLAFLDRIEAWSVLCWDGMG